MAARERRVVTATSGPHFADFCASYCRHTMEVPDGPPVGSPFVLEPDQRRFWDEALELEVVEQWTLVDELGQAARVELEPTFEQGAGGTGVWVPVSARRVWRSVGRIKPRKNGKTTELGAFALYTGGPFDGEYRPTVILAAGSKEQAGELRDQTAAFVEDPVGGSPDLRALYVVRQVAITCPTVGGVIRRVAGDGKLNHSLNPHVVVCDELHAWKTKRQRENWAALTTAQGARHDPLVVFITTEGEDEDDELYDLMQRIAEDPGTEVERVHRCFTIYRNRAAGLLVYQHGAPPNTALDDLETIKLANPASWRTAERLASDLADPMIDERTKRRLYMGIRVAGSGRWIDDAKIAESQARRATRDQHDAPAGATVAVGVDAARTRDTTAVGWAWVDPETDDVLVDCHVFSCREGVACDTFVPGGRLDNDDARDFVRGVLLERFACPLLFYDERYFDTQANDLSQDGMTVVEMHQGKPEMVAAWNELYAELYNGRRTIVEDGPGAFSEVLVPTLLLPAGAAGRTLVSHIRAAKGKRSSDGSAWKVWKDDLPIDGLAAVAMARYGARHLAAFLPKRRRVGTL